MNEVYCYDVPTPLTTIPYCVEYQCPHCQVDMITVSMLTGEAYHLTRADDVFIVCGHCQQSFTMRATITARVDVVVSDLEIGL